MRRIPFGRPMIGEQERQAVQEVLQGSVLTHGPRVREFENVFARFTGADHAVATASCTAAMHLAYLYLGLGPGDEVIAPAQTHVGTAHSIELCGARCIFVDSEAVTGNIDLDQIEQRITERTRALAVVHYPGVPVDMDRVMFLAGRHDLFVVEDCALALGAKYKGTHVGLLGDVGCFSFYPVKHITTAEGGMLITRRREIAEKVAALRAFGIDRNIVADRAVPGLYDVQMLGPNYRMNEISAALGLAQMSRLPEFLHRRQANYNTLREGLGDIEALEFLDPPGEEFHSSHYCLIVLLREPWCARRPEVIAELKSRGVETSIYYPRPVPHMSYYRGKYGFGDDTFPVAGGISHRSLALPVGPHVDNDDIHYMVSNLKETLRRVE